MTSPDLDRSAQRALEDAEQLCIQANVAILEAAHLLAAALALLARAGALSRPLAIDAAVQSLGSSEESGNRSVKWGPGARESLTIAARAAREEGRPRITVEAIARAAITSGAISPAFYDALGCSRAELCAALGLGSSPA